jgi:hypothetical protein
MKWLYTTLMMAGCVAPEPARAPWTPMPVNACEPAGPSVSVTSSSRLALNSAEDAVFVTDEDNHAVVRVDLDDGASVPLPVDGRPGRLTAHDGRVYATLADRGQVVVVDYEKGRMEVIARREIGDEPWGIVHDDGALYVALTLEGRVVRLDAETLEETASYRVPGQPRWLALHGEAGVLHVASLLGGRLTQIDVVTGETAQVPLPVTRRESGGRAPMAVRITGDPAIAPDGSSLSVPTLYVDATTPADAPAEPPVISGVAVTNPGYYAPALDVERLGRFVPSVVTFALEAGRVEEGRFRAELVAPTYEHEPFPILLGDDPVRANRGHLRDRASLPSVDRDDGLARTSYVASVAHHPSGTLLLALEGAAAVVAVCADDAAWQPGRGPGVAAAIEGFNWGGGVSHYAGEGPSAVVVSSEGDAYSFAFLDRTVRRGHRAQVATAPGSAMARATGKEHGGWFQVRGRLEASVLPDEVLVGRHHFFTARDPQMARPGAGVSCATCHFEGRADGLTWAFPEGPRQTPSLGGADETGPYTWSSAVPTLQDEAAATSTGRMLGEPMPGHVLDALAAFIGTREPSLVAVPDAASAERGRAIFQRQDTACARCHPAPLYTDKARHEVYGGVYDTPSLRGIVTTPPYLHDGSAESLAQVLDTADAGDMGHAAHLTTEERADLVAFLRSL